VAYPVFGRGRTIAGLAGSELTAGEVESATRYLCAPCSCKVKRALNGCDLLLGVEWGRVLEGGSGPGDAASRPTSSALPPVIDLPALPPTVAPAAGAEEAVQPAAPAGSLLGRSLLLTLGGLALVVVCGAATLGWPGKSGGAGS